MILITGGAGFIGSVLAQQLNVLGHADLVIVDKLEDSTKWKNLRGIKYLDYIHADELFNGDYDDLIAETDLIFHMGACSSTTDEYHKEEMRSLVHKSFEQIKSSGSVKLFKSYNAEYKDGEQLRDFIFVKDVVRAMIELADPEKAPHSGIFNLGTGKARSFLDLTKATFKAMGLTPNIEFIDMPQALRGQYQYYTQAETQKLLSALPGFEFTALESGITDYVQNYLMKENPHC